MEMWIAFLVLLIIAVPVVLIVLFVMALSGMGKLQKEVRELTVRLAQLERRVDTDLAQLAAHRPPARAQVVEAEPSVPVPPAAPVPSVAAPPERPPEPVRPVTATAPAPVAHAFAAPPQATAPPVSAAPPTPPVAASSGPAAPAQMTDFEATVGGKWSLWVGLILVLFAASFGIAYGWSHVPPAGRVALGLLAGLAFLIAGEYERGRTEEWYGEGLTAGGVALLYLSIWGAAMRYGLVPTAPAFLGMGLVTAVSVALAVRYDAISLILLASIGGYLTPVLLRSHAGGTGDAVPFWIYVTVLNAGILGVATYKRWREVNLVAFIATALLLGGWLDSSYVPSLQMTVFGFLSANFLVFMGIGSAYSLRLRIPAEVADLVYLIGVSATYFAATVYVLPAAPAPDRGIFAFALAAFLGLVAWTAMNRVPQDEGQIVTACGLAVAFSTIGFPLLLGGHPLAMAWAAEAAVLTATGNRIRRWELGGLGIVVLLLSVGILAWRDVNGPTAYPVVLANPRGATFIVLILAAAFMTWSHLARGREEKGVKDTADGLAFLAAALLVWLVGREAYGLFANMQWGAPHWGEAAWLVIFACWGALAGVLTVVGRVLRLDGLHLPAAIVALLVPPALAILGAGTVTWGWVALENYRLGSGIVVAAALAGAAAARGRIKGDPDILSGAVLPVMSSLTLTAMLSEEIYAAVWAAKFPSPMSWTVAAWLAIGGLWALAALVNVALGFRLRSLGLRWTGIALGSVAVPIVLSLSTAPETAAWPPFANSRALAIALLVIAAAVMTSLLHRRAEDLTKDERELLKPAVFGVIGAILVLWGLTQETFQVFRWHSFPSPDTWRYAAHLGVSVVWTLYAAAWLGFGIARRQSLARWLALGLFGLALLKVFLWDLGFLSLPFRMVSFGVLGLILIAVAWIYSQYGAKLRKMMNDE